MKTKEKRLKQLIAESEGFLERANNVVKHIKPIDTSKVVLTSAPFVAKKEKTTFVK